MGFRLTLFLVLVSLPAILAQEIRPAKIVVDGTTAVAKIDDNFICATLDWWPHDKCDYNQCPWGNASAIHLDLSHPLLSRAIQAFKHLRIRIGGSLQDQVVYNVGDLKSPCHPFRKVKDGLFGFSKGCLYMRRWDELNHFFSKTGVIVTFGLNALYGRHQTNSPAWGGDWVSSNAKDLMKYTILKGYEIDSWEFGNELCGSGVGARVGAEQYGKDLINLKDIINELYQKSVLKPSLIAPGGFFDQEWYAKLLQVSGSSVVNVVTHHIYNLGAGVDPSLINKILDPSHLSRISETFNNLDQTIQKHGPWASAWVGESGGAYNSGGRHVSNTFVNSFWYLDQLGMSSKYNTKVYCRQSLIGGNYGLLNLTTFVPNPIILDPAMMLIPIDDHMVHRGHGVFDTAIILDGHLYELDVHLDRFLRSASKAKISSPFPRSTLQSILIQLTVASQCKKGTLRYWLSAGPGDFLLSPAGLPTSAFYAVVIDQDIYQHKEGVKVITSSVPMKSPQFATMKNVNYLPNVHSIMEAEEKGAFASIWVDEEGYIAEGPNVNVAFITHDKELVLPFFDKILSGCTVKRLIDLAPKLVDQGLLKGVRTTNLTVEEAKGAAEMMFVGSTLPVLPIIEWDEQPIGNGRVGELTMALSNLVWDDMVAGPETQRIPVSYVQ